MSFASTITADRLPPKSAVGYLSSDIANEGQKIRMDDSEGGEIVGEPAAKIAYPDLSQFKPLKKYFNRTGYQVFPSWIYHPNGESMIVKNAEEAAKYGVVFRATTPDERAAFGVNYRWDYQGKTEWRTKAFDKKRTVDPENMEGGKNFVSRRDIATSYDQDAMIARTVASVLAAMKASGAPSAPATVDKDQWAKFQEFLAFQEATKAVAETAAEAEPVEETEDEPLVIHDMTGEEDPKAKWLAEAERLGVVVDKRWGLNRLIEECEKAA
jgi:hypothetical protein